MECSVTPQLSSVQYSFINCTFCTDLTNLVYCNVNIQTLPAPPPKMGAGLYLCFVAVLLLIHDLLRLNAQGVEENIWFCVLLNLALPPFCFLPVFSPFPYLLGLIFILYRKNQSQIISNDSSCSMCLIFIISISEECHICRQRDLPELIPTSLHFYIMLEFPPQTCTMEKVCRNKTNSFHKRK